MTGRAAGKGGTCMTAKIMRSLSRKREGMEMVQVAILVAIAIIIGLIFKSEITGFVNRTLESLNTGF